MTPAPNANTPNQRQDPTGLLLSTTAAATQAFDMAFDRLVSAASSPTTGIPDIDNALDQIRRDLDSLITTQSSEEEGVKRLLDDILNKEVLQHLTKKIEDQIDIHIDKHVNTLVEKELDKYVPRDLRTGFDEQRAQLLSLQVQIHNAEAMRTNSSVNTRGRFGDNLQHLLNNSGHQTTLFPTTVDELLKFNDDKVFHLVQFFGMENPDSGSRIPNLNWFLRMIGVTYQYVYRR